MSLLITAERTAQPLGAVGLNRRSPLARGLVSLINPASGLKDLVSGAVGTPTGLAVGLTAKGKAWVCDGSTTLVDMGGMPPGLPDLSGIYTVAAIVIPNAVSTARNFMQLRDAASRNVHIICGSMSAANVGLSSSTANDGKVITAANGGIYTVIGSGSAGVMVDGYINGITGSSPGTGGFTPSTQTGYTLGKRIGGTSIDGRILLAAIWNRWLSVEEKLLFSRNPWQLLERTRNNLSVGASGGGAGLDGSAAAQVSASGALSIQVPMVGAATTSVTASGTLTTLDPLAGQAAAVSLASGTLSVTFALSGAALANALATGALSTSIALSGAALANALATGNLLAGGAGALAGNAAAQAAATGALSTAIPLQGSASALALAAGGLTTAVPLGGVAVAVSHVTGDLTVTVSGLSGAAVVQALASGTLSIQVSMSGAAVAQALAAGNLVDGTAAARFVDPRYTLRLLRRAHTLRLPRRDYTLRCAA